MKNLRLVVKPPLGEVQVSAPRRISDSDIIDFVYSHLDWIKNQRLLIAERNYPPALQYLDGELHDHWGVTKALRWINSRSKTFVKCTDEEILFHYSTPLSADKRKKSYEEFCCREIKKHAPVFVDRYQRALGVDLNEWRIKKMKTRWGSCNIIARRIWLNSYLVAYPPQCLEYVIVHELAHLHEPHHNTRFWNIVESQLPHWRQSKALLDLR